MYEHGMDMKQILENQEPDTGQSRRSISSQGSDHDGDPIDSGTALQIFLDHMPINSIPGIKTTPIVELKVGDSLDYAIKLLYEKDVIGAPIVDVSSSDPLDESDRSASAPTVMGKIMDRYIGFIHLHTMILWCLEEFKKQDDHHPKVSGGSGETQEENGLFLSILEQCPHIRQTKVGELAKSFLWEPYFPVNLQTDTLFHVLLLLSKHKLSVVPVLQPSSSTSQLIGFITQNAVLHLLLKSSGLEWFDNIANKTLSEFRFENADLVFQVYEDQSLEDALHILHHKRLDSVAVANRQTGQLIGCIRTSDVYLLLEINDLLDNLKNMTVCQFMELDKTKHNINDPTIESGLAALLSSGSLCLRNKYLSTMRSAVTFRGSDTLVLAMKKMGDMNSESGFIVDEESNKVKGLLELRDIIVRFAPPCLDSRFQGGGFFDSILQQSGCHVEHGTLIRDR